MFLWAFHENGGEWVREHLTACGPAPQVSGVSRPGGRSGFLVRGGKSGLHGNAVPDNLRRGLTPGTVPQKTNRLRQRHEVRVKGCGKSAPRTRQRERRRQTPPGARSNRGCAVPRRHRGTFSSPQPGLIARGCRRRQPQRNGHHVRESPPGPYQTRLIGRLTFAFSRLSGGGGGGDNGGGGRTA